MDSYAKIIFSVVIVCLLLLIGIIIGYCYKRAESFKKDSDIVREHMINHAQKTEYEKYVNEHIYKKNKKLPTHPDSDKLSHQYDKENMSEQEGPDDHDNKITDRHASARGKEEHMSAFARWRDEIEDPQLIYWH